MELSQTHVALTLLALLSCGYACRIGGAAGTDVVAVITETPSGAGGSSHVDAGRSTLEAGTQLDAGTQADVGPMQGGAGHDQGTGGTASDAGTLLPPRDAGGDAGGACTAPHVEVCDPVANQGCFDSMQCAADLASDVLSGFCVFSTPIDAGVPCIATPVTDSCAPGSACSDGACIELCFCDGDCSAGECCGQPIGTLGFKLCGAC